jgi:hypothetical protein
MRSNPEAGKSFSKTGLRWQVFILPNYLIGNPVQILTTTKYSVLFIKSDRLLRRNRIYKGKDIFKLEKKQIALAAFTVKTEFALG